MSRRIIALVTLAVAVSSLSACADSISGPDRSSLTPSAAPRYQAVSTGTCRGGWVSSEGRCG
jgi:hypothetical protein